MSEEGKQTIAEFGPPSKRIRPGSPLADFGPPPKSKAVADYAPKPRSRAVADFGSRPGKSGRLRGSK